MLLDLPEDVLLTICIGLPAQDILSLKQVRDILPDHEGTRPYTALIRRHVVSSTPLGP